MTFADPELLALAVLAPIVILGLGVVDGLWRRRLVGRLGDGIQVQRMMASASTWRRWVKRALLAAGLALIAIATARPQRAGVRNASKAGLDVVLALDVSKSMLVEDVGDTRLGKARAYLDALLPKLANDRVGALVFAKAAAHFPLTDDKEVTAQFLHDLGPADLPGGSSLGEALTVGTCMLRPGAVDSWGGECASMTKRGHGGDPLPGEPDEAPATATIEEVAERSKVLVLVTDGAEGLAGPGRAGLVAQVESAKQLGITILVIGVGTERGGDVPEIDDRGVVTGKKLDRDGRLVRSALDGESLRELAALGGDPNRYFEVGLGAVDPLPVVAALNALTRGALERKEGRAMDEWYAAFLFPGFMLLVIEACLGTRRRVRFPEGNP